MPADVLQAATDNLSCRKLAAALPALIQKSMLQQYHNWRPDAGLTQNLKLAPQLALLTAHAVHDLSDVLEMLLELVFQGWGIGALPKSALVKGHWAGFLERLIGNLQTPIVFFEMFIRPI